MPAGLGESGGLPELDGLGRGPNVMNAQDLDTLCQSCQRHGDGTWGPIARVLRAADCAYEAFARGAQKNGSAKAMKDREVVQESEIMFQRFAEAALVFRRLDCC